MKKYLERLKNAGTIVSIVSMIGLLLVQFGVNIDLKWLSDTINMVCSIGVLIGILNNPTTTGVDLPKKEE